MVRTLKRWAVERKAGLAASYREWYEGWGLLLVSCIVIPGLFLGLAATGLPILWLPLLLWLSRGKVMD